MARGLAVEERGELFPEAALRVKSPEPAHRLNPAFEAETIALGSFSRNREELLISQAAGEIKEFMSNTDTIN